MPVRPADGFVPDRVVSAARGDPVDVWIYSVLPKEGWVPHSPGDFTHAEYPGSAVKYGSQVYELVRVEETARDGYQIRYGLRTWNPQFAIRHLVDYTLETQREAAAIQWEVEKVARLRNLILWLAPFAGFAPDPMQRAWAEKTGLSMGWISVGSAVFGCAVAFVLRGAFENVYWTVGLLYLALESFARVFWIGISHRPHGSPLLTMPYILWQACTRTKPGNQEAGMTLMMRQDEVSRNPDASSLRIRSWYFDTNLAGSALVNFEGIVYRPVRWRREGKGLSRRWVYELEKAEAGALCRDYTNPRTPDRQRAVEEFTHRLDVAQSFTLFWGVYPRKDQLRLQLVYQHDGPRSTAITAGLFLMVGLAQLGLTAGLYRVTILALAGPVYLILESAYRLYKAKALAEPAGSVVGYLLRLAIRPPTSA